MGLFDYPSKGKKVTFEVNFPDRDGICGHLWRCPKREDEPSDWEKLSVVLFTNAEEEGEKRGIANASRIYVPILEELKKQYEMLDAFAKKCKEQNDAMIQKQLDLLKTLEQKKADLESQRKEKIECAAQKFGVPASTIASALAGGKSYCDFFPILSDILDYFYRKKLKEIADNEAKYFKKTVAEVWEPKMKELKEKFQKLSTEVAKEAKEYVDLFVQTVFEISEIKRQISQLEILLEAMQK